MVVGLVDVVRARWDRGKHGESAEEPNGDVQGEGECDDGMKELISVSREILAAIKAQGALLTFVMADLWMVVDSRNEGKPRLV